VKQDFVYHVPVRRINKESCRVVIVNLCLTQSIM
jgi:hypothetical protein